MKTQKIFAILFMLLIVSACSKDENKNNGTPPVNSGIIEVVINDIPYPTERFLRIGYTMKMWEYEKDGLELLEIIVRDDATKKELMKLDPTSMPFIFRNPVVPIPYFNWDVIDHYYISIQLPILLGQPVPAKISHKLVFKRAAYNDIVSVEGGVFSPRTNETPIAISSPMRGNHWVFASQSTMGYHFYVLFFTMGDIYTGERYAFDNGRLNEQLTSDMTGDSAFNESYICYGDTLYAVADGVIADLQDGKPENNGHLHDQPINSLEDYPGNYVVLKIDDTHYAAYCHCQPNTFFVNNGDAVVEGQPLGLLGNSGNSGMPHLHFQIMDRNNILFSYGLPYVLKEYKKINEFGPDFNLLNPPVEIFTNAMMEEWSVIDFDY
ncbi:MAG: M23 family metallopeptidase [Bacteroidia bacterium]|nr:M23 family metallopeptidase [Bacteroidia bacterium]